MLNLADSLNNIRRFEELSEKGTVIHRLHPASKIITTVIYTLVVMSFNRYEISGLLPLILYPVFIMALAEIPYKPILRIVLIALPFALCIGIFNVFINNEIAFRIGGIGFSYGFLSLITISLKSVLTVMSALILVSTTSITKIAAELVRIKVPRIFVLQFVLVYRYISVLVEETGRMTRAYSLRSPSQKGINFKDLGSLIGHLLLRTFDRADRIYSAMCCRGFNGEYNVGYSEKVKGQDYLYIIVCVLFFLMVRLLNISVLIGLFMTGVK